MASQSPFMVCDVVDKLNRLSTFVIFMLTSSSSFSKIETSQHGKNKTFFGYKKLLPLIKCDSDKISYKV